MTCKLGRASQDARWVGNVPSVRRRAGWAFERAVDRISLRPPSQPTAPVVSGSSNVYAMGCLSRPVQALASSPSAPVMPTLVWGRWAPSSSCLACLDDQLMYRRCPAQIAYCMSARVLLFLSLSVRGTRHRKGRSHPANSSTTRPSHYLRRRRILGVNLVL